MKKESPFQLITEEDIKLRTKREQIIIKKYGEEFYKEFQHNLHECPKCKDNFDFFTEECPECETYFGDIIQETWLKFKNRPEKNQNKIKEALGFFTNFIEMGEKFIKIQPLFYDKSCIWWVWNHELSKYDMIDDVDLMNRIDQAIPNYDTINSKVKNEILESLKRVGRKHIPKEAPNKWIQFKDKAYSINSDNVYEVKPNYFFTNPIPWKLGKSEETPIIDKLFEEWVGKDYIKTLYEIIAYCCYTDYPIQVLFCLHGNGRNGKSTFLKILSKFIGLDNICSTELDLLVGHTSSRFESFKLYKKLICLMGETNFGVLDKSSLLKKLTGGDLIGYEMKGKKPFDDYNYAKMLIASNSLPTSDDTSEGFYRRWVIIDFPNQFPEGKDITLTIPDEEYENLALKSCKILKEIIYNGKFTNQGSIEERKFKYIMASNPFPLFLQDHCEKDEESYISYNELYTAYVKYLNEHKKRRISRKEFKISLEDEGFWLQKTSKKIIKQNGEYDFKTDNWIEGLKLKNYSNCSNYTNICTQNTHMRDEVAKVVQKEQLEQNKLQDEYITDYNDIPMVELLYSQLAKNGKVQIQELQDKLTFDISKLVDELKKRGDYYESSPGFISKVI